MVIEQERFHDQEELVFHDEDIYKNIQVVSGVLQSYNDPSFKYVRVSLLGCPSISATLPYIANHIERRELVELRVMLKVFKQNGETRYGFNIVGCLDKDRLAHVQKQEELIRQIEIEVFRSHGLH